MRTGVKMTADLYRTFLDDLFCAITVQDLEKLRIHYLGKQGLITGELKFLGTMDPESRKARGAELNRLRDACQEALHGRRVQLEEEDLQQKLEQEKKDMTLPALPSQHGTHHLITHTLREIVRYFECFGFCVGEGPDIETEAYNFNALNIPDHHPARQNHDTFYVEGDAPLLLRTHTSTVQVRTLKKHAPPLRILAPGRVYRADYDATHLPMFHQMEGFVVEEGIHLGHLKGCLIDFCRVFFGKEDLKVRFRPSFFPFTEPSFEIDICWGEDRWLEVLGCGMIHPNVLRNVGLDPERHQGFAFGMGIERFAMLKHGVADIRNFVSGDLRWNRQEGIPSALAGLTF